jgi:hypothetical protein
MNILKLPLELREMIEEYLAPVDLFHLCLTCRRFKQELTISIVWKKYFKKYKKDYSYVQFFKISHFDCIELTAFQTLFGSSYLPYLPKITRHYEKLHQIQARDDFTPLKKVQIITKEAIQDFVHAIIVITCPEFRTMFLNPTHYTYFDSHEVISRQVAHLLNIVEIAQIHEKFALFILQDDEIRTRFLIAECFGLFCLTEIAISHRAAAISILNDNEFKQSFLQKRERYLNINNFNIFSLKKIAMHYFSPENNDYEYNDVNHLFDWVAYKLSPL